MDADLRKRLGFDPLAPYKKEPDDEDYIHPEADVLEPAFESQIENLELEQAKLEEQAQRYPIEDLAAGIGEGIAETTNQAIAPLQGLTQSAFFKTQDPLAKHLAAQKPLDLRSRLKDQRAQEAIMTKNQMDLRQRLGMQPLEELKTRLALDKQLTTGKADEWRPTNVTLRDGTSRTLLTNSKGQFIEPGTNADVSDQVFGPSYAPAIVKNPATGEYEQVNRALGTSSTVSSSKAPDQKPGETKRDYTERKTRENELRTAQELKKIGFDYEQAIAEASENRKAAAELTKTASTASSSLEALERAEKLYDKINGDQRQIQAYVTKETANSPIGQQLASFVNLYNKDLDEVNSTITSMANKYILDTSGAAVSAAEDNRLKAVLPIIGQDKATFKNRMATFKRIMSNSAVINSLNQIKNNAALTEEQKKYMVGTVLSEAAQNTQTQPTPAKKPLTINDF